MKKLPLLLTTLLFAAALMAGCGKQTPLLSALDYELNPKTNETNRGVSIGDSPETFLTAYGDYRIFTSIEGGEYQALDKDEIPFDLAITTLLPTFFIDGQPTDPDRFCKENEIAKTDLLTFLSSEDYLQSHTVIYYYLSFTWQNGSITSIQSEYMDYNEEAAYDNQA